MSGSNDLEAGEAARPARYLLVGGLCAAAHNIVMIGGDRAGGHYLPLIGLSFALVTPLGYALHSRFTFRRPASAGGFARFAAGVAVGVPLSLLFMALLCTGFRLPVPVAAPIATALLFAYNYLAAQLAILRRLRLR